MKIGFVSLGCPKNRVDSEVMLGVAHGSGWKLVDDPGDAVSPGINSCSFVNAPAFTVVDGLVFAVLVPSVMSVAVTV